MKIKGLPTYHGKSVHKEFSLWEIDDIYLINKNKRNIEECRRVGIAYTLDDENKIFIHVLEKTYSNMTPDQKKIFDARVQEVANQFGVSSTKGLAGGAGLLVLGNLGGFATYTLMTSVLSTLSFWRFRVRRLHCRIIFARFCTWAIRLDCDGWCCNSRNREARNEKNYSFGY